MNIKTRQVISVALITAMLGVSGVAFAQDNQGEIHEGHLGPYLAAPQSASAAEAEETDGAQIVQDAFIAALQSPGHAAPGEAAVRELYVTSTGYNSEPNQTDGTPFITANGEHVYWGGVAANFLPFGTKIKIPDHFGDKVFTVNDRMAKRFSNRVDVWFEHASDAIQWGRRTVRIVVVK